MYIGRIVAVGKNTAGTLCALYRVSSRSFPNRTTAVRDDAISIVPKPGHEGDVHKNPYIAYNCVRVVAGGQVAVVTNGSQTDPIAEKIAMGMPVRDALALSSLALDFEKDDYNTPRVSSIIDLRDESAWLGIVRDDGLEVRRIPLEAGKCWYVATYEENRISAHHSDAFDASTADEACAYILGGGRFAKRLNPVTGVAAMATGHGGFALATQDAPAAS